MAAILNSAILILPSSIQPFCTKLWLKLFQSASNSFILTQLDDGSHLEFGHLGFSHFAQKKNFSHSFWLNLMMAAILNSANLNSTILDSAILVFPLKLTHTCQDWFPPFAQKTSLIHSDSTLWWQPSWILPSWIQPFCTKLWLKLIQSESNSFILT